MSLVDKIDISLFDAKVYLASKSRAQNDEQEFADVYLEYLKDEEALKVGAKFNGLVSIVVPTYNAEDYLSYTLDSIKAQTYHEWECIVVDDASTDDSLKIANSYVKKDSRFKVISHKSNAGLSSARNTGLRMVHGSMVCFLDSDDLMMSQSIANRRRAIVNSVLPDCIGSYSGSIHINHNIKTPPSVTRARNQKVLNYLQLSGKCPFTANQPMFKTALLRNFGGFNETLNVAEDWELWLRILRHGYCFVPTSIIDLCYRKTPNSMVRQRSLEHLKIGMELYYAVNSSLDAGKVYSSAYCVYEKPLSAYKMQEDVYQRVFMFAAMVLTNDIDNHEIQKVITKSLPDFMMLNVSPTVGFQAVCDGVERQRAGAAALSLEDKEKLAVPVYDKIISILSGSHTMDRDVHFEQGVNPYKSEKYSELEPGFLQEIGVVFLPRGEEDIYVIASLLPLFRNQDIKVAVVDFNIYFDKSLVREFFSDRSGVCVVGYNNFVFGLTAPALVVDFDCNSFCDDYISGAACLSKICAVLLVLSKEKKSNYGRHFNESIDLSENDISENDLFEKLMVRYDIGMATPLNERRKISCFLLCFFYKKLPVDYIVKDEGGLGGVAPDFLKKANNTKFDPFQKVSYKRKLKNKMHACGKRLPSRVKRLVPNFLKNFFRR